MDTPAAAVTPAQGGWNASVWDSLYPAFFCCTQHVFFFSGIFFVLSFLIVVTKAMESKTEDRGGLEPLCMLVVFLETLLQVDIIEAFHT